MFGAHEIDALHPRGDVLVIAAVAAQAHEVFGELQADGERLLVAAAADRARRLLEPLHRDLASGKLFENRLHALGLVAADERLFHLLQVDRRAILGGDFAELVARQHVDQQIVLLEAVYPFLEQAGAGFGRARRAAGADCANWASKRRRALTGSFK